jgi:hypothetical protein
VAVYFRALTKATGSLPALTPWKCKEILHSVEKWGVFVVLETLTNAPGSTISQNGSHWRLNVRSLYVGSDWKALYTAWKESRQEKAPRLVRVQSRGHGGEEGLLDYNDRLWVEILWGWSEVPTIASGWVAVLLRIGGTGSED